MFTILVSLMAMRGYFGGVNIKIYIVIDLVLIAVAVCYWLIAKVMKMFNKM